jgi:hypothetical protein
MRQFKARPTLYSGIQMRSRNEAGFAQWLDRFYWNWEYEPDCFANRNGQYLPDFRVLFNERPGSGIYVEVKPTREMAWAARDSMLPIRSTYPNAALAVVAPMSTRHYVCHGALVPGSDVWRQTNGHWPDLPVEVSSPCRCGRPWIDPEFGRCETCWRFCCMDCGVSLPGFEEPALGAALLAVRRDECCLCGDSSGGGYCARCISLQSQPEKYGNTVTGDVRTDLALDLTPDPGPGPDLCAICWAERGVA